ncbi:hypothetical protein QC762_100090 [Podospora pseudocomata]|uniref:LTD domain-containing protein n=1 Tax=Podospora pseudocomata TaxID=2093779 RepID=A0ABR0GRD0_9PEZI|nr:hypothetical protein QC762_100090 [Podospora pseudocomata]
MRRRCLPIQFGGRLSPSRHAHVIVPGGSCALALTGRDSVHPLPSPASRSSRPRVSPRPTKFEPIPIFPTYHPKMPLKGYGIWKGTATKWDGTAKPGHGHITFSDTTSTRLDAAVNIESKSSDSRLVYWVIRDLQPVSATFTHSLQALPRGFHPQKGTLKTGSLGLDFLRLNLFHPQDGILLSHNTPGTSHNILDYLNPILNQAVVQKADIYLFGEPYNDKTGIHDIHMNQGNSGQWKKDNGIFQDGGIILAFPDGHWEGIFLAFAVQTYKTDEQGMPVGDTFAKLLGGGKQPGEGDEEEPEPIVGDGIKIEAALVNPHGPDQQPSRGDGETVYLLNRSVTTVDLEGWRIENGSGQSHVLNGVSLAVQSKKGVAVPGVALGNKGGVISLKDNGGKLVHQVKYSRDQAQREGALVYFLQK